MTVGIRAKLTEQVNLGSSQRRREEARVEWCPWYRNKRSILGETGCSESAQPWWVHQTPYKYGIKDGSEILIKDA